MAPKKHTNPIHSPNPEFAHPPRRPTNPTFNESTNPPTASSQILDPDDFTRPVNHTGVLYPYAQADETQPRTILRRPPPAPLPADSQTANPEPEQSTPTQRPSSSSSELPPIPMAPTIQPSTSHPQLSHHTRPLPPDTSSTNSLPNAQPNPHPASQTPRHHIRRWEPVLGPSILLTGPNPIPVPAAWSPYEPYHHPSPNPSHPTNPTSTSACAIPSTTPIPTPSTTAIPTPASSSRQSTPNPSSRQRTPESGTSNPD
ncbi:hypothetical protein MMC12_004483 [Toensbergia leucococca]|nr:hypothetical protein [Toensbergia leucococca]